MVLLWRYTNTSRNRSNEGNHADASELLCDCEDTLIRVETEVMKEIMLMHLSCGASVKIH